MLFACNALPSRPQAFFFAEKGTAEVRGGKWANSLDPQLPFLYDQPAPKRVLINPYTFSKPLIADREKPLFLSSMTR
jgi:hypothetical protein